MAIEIKIHEIKEKENIFFNLKNTNSMVLIKWGKIFFLDDSITYDPAYIRKKTYFISKPSCTGP